MTMRRVLDIEDVVKWTIRDELPKMGGSGGGTITVRSVSPMFAMIATGPVDNWSREPGFPIALGPPHEDAYRVKDAIEALTVEDLDITGFARSHGTDPAGINVETMAEAAVAAAIEPLHGLVVSRARLGSRPDWSSAPEVEPVRSLNGQHTVFVKEKHGIEVNGTFYEVERDAPVTAKKRHGGHYPTGSFSKITYAPSRVAHYTEWAEYAAWHAALVHLAGELDGVLTSIRPTAPAAPRRPWFGERDAKFTGRLIPVQGPAAPGKPSVIAGPPLPRTKHGPVRHLGPSAA